MLQYILVIKILVSYGQIQFVKERTLGPFDTEGDCKIAAHSPMMAPMLMGGHVLGAECQVKL